MTSTPNPAAFGRVDPDGTVYVTTADGERSVGQVPGVTEAEALAFYTRRFEALDLEVGLLERRLASGALSPDEARGSIRTARSNITGANAVGDLDGLLTRLDALAPVVAQANEARKAERSRRDEETRVAKEAMVGEAEKLAEGTDWRGGVNRFRSLLDEWKALPRIDRATDDALWHRFSAARTTYTRRRKTNFAEQAEKRDTARVEKERIIAEARPLATSTDWGATAGAFRDLMTRWKAAGAAPRDVDEALWTEFRGLQDTFFSARASNASEQDEEFRANQNAKEALLAQAESTISPEQDMQAARSAFRTFLDKYNAVGKVPRDAMRGLDNRVRTLESSLKRAEDAEWRRTDPEARSRAEETVAMLSKEIDRLTEKATKAQARGDNSAASKAQDSIATYQTWLQQARSTLADFSR